MPEGFSSPTPARRVFIDTEWTAPPWQASCQLMWVGLADEEGRAWYGISAEAEIDPARNAFMAGVFRLISPTEPRLTRAQLAAEVRAFCGDVTEFWAWIPTVESFASFFKLDAAPAAALHRQHREVDLHMLRALVQPWPAGWPVGLHDLQAAAAAAGVQIPPRAPNHLHPQVHAEWNRSLYQRIAQARAAGPGQP